jgi:tRNA A37 threonylcarbamoyladenosine dehydratase
MRKTHRSRALADPRVAVIGLGAIGRQATVQLASLGVGRLALVDPDVFSRCQRANLGYPATLAVPRSKRVFRSSKLIARALTCECGGSSTF